MITKYLERRLLLLCVWIMMRRFQIVTIVVSNGKEGRWGSGLGAGQIPYRDLKRHCKLLEDRRQALRDMCEVDQMIQLAEAGAL